MVDQESPVWGNLVGAHWAQRGQRSDGGLIQAIKAWGPARTVKSGLRGLRAKGLKR